MSVPMKKLPIDQVEIAIHGEKDDHFVGPKRKLRLIQNLLSELKFQKVAYKSDESVPWRVVAAHEIEKYGEPALMLRGARHKAELTQKELAKRLGIAQYNLSKMENGTRPISKKMARQLSKILNVNYRVFL